MQAFPVLVSAALVPYAFGVHVVPTEGRIFGWRGL